MRKAVARRMAFFVAFISVSTGKNKKQNVTELEKANTFSTLSYHNFKIMITYSEGINTNTITSELTGPYS